MLFHNVTLETATTRWPSLTSTTKLNGRTSEQCLYPMLFCVVVALIWVPKFRVIDPARVTVGRGVTRVTFFCQIRRIKVCIDDRVGEGWLSGKIHQTDHFLCNLITWWWFCKFTRLLGGLHQGLIYTPLRCSSRCNIYHLGCETREKIEVIITYG